MIEIDFKNISKEDLQQIYNKDYNGDMGLVKYAYIEWCPANKSHMYLAFYDDPLCDEHRYFLGHFFISFGQNGFTMDFAGCPIMGSNNKAEVEVEYQKQKSVPA